jgi:hypothetical protein
MDVEVYKEEQVRVILELEGLLNKNGKLEKGNETKEQYKQRMQAII